MRDDSSLDKGGGEKTKRSRQVLKTGGNSANVTHLNFREKQSSFGIISHLYFQKDKNH